MTPYQIGRYRVLDTLGVGGFATVFLADDPTRLAPVALKILAADLAADPGLRRRFVAEARVMQRLADPGLVTVHDVGEHDGRPFFVMEYCERGTLSQRVASMPRTASIDEAVQLAGVMTGAISTVHRAGIVHRDIKPGNFMIRRTDGRTRTMIGGVLGPDEELVLGDFGLAKVIDVQALGRTLAAGTPGYSAPEQFLGDGTVDVTADVYAASATLVAMITGIAPRPAVSDRDLAFEAPVIAATGALQVELTRGLAVDRSRRHRSIDEWHQGLVQAVNYGRRTPRSTVVDAARLGPVATSPASGASLSGSSGSPVSSSGPSASPVPGSQPAAGSPVSGAPSPVSAPGDELGIDHLADVRIIGRGGFSTVYAARHTLLNQMVAVKVLSRQLNETDRRHFERECQVMGRMSDHPNVVTVYNAGYSRHDTPYVTMELVEGGTLADLLVERTRLPWHEAVELVAPIADALGHAHRQGILHRDVKPENILLQDGVPKLTDFGIAVVRDAAGATSTHVTASWLHTAPETFDNERDERSDVYSLASTLYHLVAGRAPFWRAGDDSLSPLMKRLISDPAPPFDPDLVPVGVNGFFASALAKNPDHRPQTTDAFTAALRAVGTGAATTGRILPLAAPLGFRADTGVPTAADVTGPTVHLSGVESGPPVGFRRQLPPDRRGPSKRLLASAATTVAVIVLALAGLTALVAATGRGTAIGFASQDSSDDESTDETTPPDDNLRAVSTTVTPAAAGTGASGAGGPDVDGDGVANSADACPGTAAGATVDDDGCSAAQRLAPATSATTRRAATTALRESLTTETPEPTDPPTTAATTRPPSTASTTTSRPTTTPTTATTTPSTPTTEPSTTHPTTTTSSSITRPTVSITSLTIPKITPTIIGPLEPAGT
ncbi:MAG: serine/threonine-protein kinase [Acidimicrobiales bacterium]